MDGPAPAIFNAVAHATGVDVTRLPLTPERLMDADGGRAWLTPHPRASPARVNGRPPSSKGIRWRGCSTRCARSGLTGTKEGCGEGECGACARAARRRARQQLPDAAGAGRGRVDHDHRRRRRPTARCTPIQESFLECGGAQCGICTPGMVLAARRAAVAEPGSDRGGRARRARRQPVPLHRLHAHLRVRAARARASARDDSASSIATSCDPGVAGRGARRSRAASRRAAVRRRDRSDGGARSGAPAAGPLRQPVRTAGSCAASTDRGQPADVSIGALDHLHRDPHVGGCRRAVSRCWCRGRAKPAASPRRTAARSAATSPTRRRRPTHRPRCSSTTRSSSSSRRAARAACPTRRSTAATRRWTSRRASSSPA